MIKKNTEFPIGQKTRMLFSYALIAREMLILCAFFHKKCWVCVSYFWTRAILFYTLYVLCFRSSRQEKEICHALLRFRTQTDLTYTLHTGIAPRFPHVHSARNSD